MQKSREEIRVFARTVGEVPRLSRAEERELMEQACGGDRDARGRVLEAGLRLVVVIAREYEKTGVPLLDLISEGQDALANTVDGFREIDGSAFHIFAAVNIRRAIERRVGRAQPPAGFALGRVAVPSRMAAGVWAAAERTHLRPRIVFLGKD